MMLIESSFILLLLAFLLVQPCILQFPQSSSNFSDQSSLIAFKSKINATALAGNWSTTTNFCNWIGVSCSLRRQRVTALNLSYFGLQGTISPHVGNLSFLVSLDLSNNSFYGFLPHEICRLHRLKKLQLSNNLLEGSIPPTIHNFQKLEYLTLSGNKLSGVIPKDLGLLPKLRKLRLSNNHLIGTIPLSLSNMSSLEYLNLAYNSLTGPFPPFIFNLSSLTMMGFTENHFSGTLPMDLCIHCPNLQGLYISANEFSGKLPSQFNHCRELSVLALSYNKFDGSITKGFRSLEKLEMLYLGVNNLTGNIPSDLWGLQNLIKLDFAMNDLTGTIPQNSFNITSLQSLWLMGNSFSGTLPLDSKISCSNLETLILDYNKISGHIPSYLSNCSKLIVVDFSENLLSGSIPKSLGNLKYLKTLRLSFNNLTEDSGHEEQSFITSLTSCRFLVELSISNNPLNITIPDAIGNFSDSLEMIYASYSQIKGKIPKGIGSLKNLNLLSLMGNSLTGIIPSTIRGMASLQRLYLEENKIEGFIPEQLCQLKNLGDLSLTANSLSGPIPNCIGNLSFLQILNLSYNKLKSSIPPNMWNLENLLFLDLSSNSLGGFLSPNMKILEVIEYMDLSQNQITGNVSSVIGSFESLRYLDLSNNLFQGVIPQSFGQLKGLDELDLSNNNISGAIPKSLEALPFLKRLNLSFNKLSGEIPSGGTFTNFTAESFISNEALCGNPIFGVPPCTSQSSQGSREKKIFLRYIVPVIATIIIFAALFIMRRRHPQHNMQIPALPITLPAMDHRIVSYEELRCATNNFCESNLLGTGGFSSVYKGILFDGTIVAVKVLNLQLEGAFISFEAECKVLRAIRHRNLVKIISTCSNNEFRALVLQYMSNGSLEKWLYSHNYCLTLIQRVSIVVDVALALEYLHNGQSESVVHCDLKPSNILLDEDMVAHVGDFGIAKILDQNKDVTQTKTLGTLGYIAPEYGFKGRVSSKCDIYSYGIILLEIITRKKPIDEMFVGELNMRQWIMSFPNRMEVVEDGLLGIEDGRDVNDMQTILLSILELGLKCSEELPDERPSIKYVVAKVDKIKFALVGNKNKGI